MISQEKKGKIIEFNPNILCFCCNWCSYAGADLAGVSRFQYPYTIRIVRVMCSGRVDPVFVIESLKKGADGVLISGCHFGECHYKSGNYKANRRIILLKKYLEEMGIDPKRIRFEFVSASEGQKFATVVEEFVIELKELGPLALPIEVT